MAFDVFFCTLMDADEFQSIAEKVRKEHPKIFPTEFHITDASAAGQMSRKCMFEDFGFPVRSQFILGLKNKQNTGIIEVMKLVTFYFHVNSFLATYDGKKAFPPWPV